VSDKQGVCFNRKKWACGEGASADKMPAGSGAGKNLKLGNRGTYTIRTLHSGSGLSWERAVLAGMAGCPTGVSQGMLSAVALRGALKSGTTSLMGAH
jgi:hypothetical protein